MIGLPLISFNFIDRKFAQGIPQSSINVKFNLENEYIHSILLRHFGVGGKFQCIINTKISLYNLFTVNLIQIRQLGKSRGRILIQLSVNPGRLEFEVILYFHT